LGFKPKWRLKGDNQKELAASKLEKS